MRWNDERESDNVVDARGGGGGGGFPGGAVGVSGIGGVVIVILGLLFGFDPRVLLSQLDGGQPQYREQQRTPSEYRDQARGRNPDQQRRAEGNDPMRHFVSVVLASTEETWTKVFRQANRNYQEPKLVLFTGAVRSACGNASAAMGPFYCPGDRQVYLDMSFFRDMSAKLGAPGDFAQAYVIAHEVGHHVQTLLGITQRADEVRRRGGGNANDISVRVELQADCFAGVWANQAQQGRLILERGDIEEGIQAAASVGDDRLQKRSQGYVVPESFTHGSSAQRVRWFRRGLETGQITACDTFKADRL